MIKSKNFCLQLTPNIIVEEYHNCNFTQENPHTRIFPEDDTPRTFVECNLINAVPPIGSTLTNCNTTQVIIMIEDGTEDLIIKDQTVPIKKYKDQILGSLDPKTLELISKPRDISRQPPKNSRAAKLLKLVQEREEAREAVLEKDDEADILAKTLVKEIK